MTVMVQIIETLVWNIKLLTVEIINHPPFLNVEIIYDKNKFRLLAKYSIELNYLDIEDILGNGFGTGFQGKGIGSLLVNTLFLYSLSLLKESAMVSGTMSAVGELGKITLKHSHLVMNEHPILIPLEKFKQAPKEELHPLPLKL